MKLRARFAGISLLALVLAAACGAPSSSTTTPASASPALPVAPPPPEVSTIVVPLRTTLTPLTAEAESRVPRTFSDTRRERGFDIRYEVSRDPIRLQMIGAGLHAATTVRYSLEACRGRFPCVSCGVRQAPREVQIKLHSKVEWDASWRLRSSTRPLPLDFPSRCKVFGLDVTDLLIRPAIEEQLADAAQQIDRNTLSLTNLKPQAEQIWKSLQVPIDVAPRTYLVLEPAEVALGPISGSGVAISSTLTMRARTRVVVGQKPAVVAKPLPALRIGTLDGGGMRVPLDLELSYEDATRIASAELAGKTYKVNGRDLVVDAIRVLPSSAGKLLIEASIDYRGGALKRYRGTVLLEGTPSFDPATSTVIIPDLEYAIDRSRGNAFVRTAERLAHDTLRARLRENAKFPLTARINTLRAEITRALTRPLASGVQLRGRVDTIQPTSVTPLPHVLLVRVVATGAAEIDIR